MTETRSATPACSRSHHREPLLHDGAHGWHVEVGRRALLGDGERGPSEIDIGPSQSGELALSWGWCEYLEGRYDEAARWLDIALDVAPDTFDHIITTPLSINVALGRGDVASALATARTMVDTDQLASHRCELSTATGAAYMWAGLGTEARAILARAATLAKLEHQPSGEVVVLTYRAVVDLEDGNIAAANAAAVTATATAQSAGLADYHGGRPRTRSEPAPAPTPSSPEPTRAMRSTSFGGHRPISASHTSSRPVATRCSTSAIPPEQRSSQRRGA